MKEVFVNAKKINRIGLVSILPIVVLIIVPFWIKWGDSTRISIKTIKDSLSISENNVINGLIIIFAPTVLIFTGILVHELIHGLFMVVFSKKGIESVKIGFQKKTLMVYAHCKEPLVAKKMLIISLAPFVFLGLIPVLYAFISGSFVACFFGLVMSISAIGDFIYSYLILKTGLEKKILDHNSEVGFKIMETNLTK